MPGCHDDLADFQASSNFYGARPALAGGTEFLGGLLLLAGFLTRLAGLSLAGTMAVAILTAHPSAFFASNDGMEYPLTLLLASLTLAIGGAGKFSVDQKLSA